MAVPMPEAEPFKSYVHAYILPIAQGGLMTWHLHLSIQIYNVHQTNNSVRTQTNTLGKDAGCTR